MKPTMRLEGGAAAQRKIRAMGRALTRKTLVPIMKKKIEPIAEDMRAHAARGSGELADSITVSTRLSKAQRAKRERIAPIEVYAGPGPLPQAIQEEFGNYRQEPRPFIRPAYDAGGERAARGIAEDGLDAIMKAAKKG